MRTMAASILTLSNDERVSARSVVIASGARYRRLAVENLDAFEGASVHYWASPLEAKLCAGQEVALVGAGNSAGQAAVYLASQVAKVWLLVRGPRPRGEHVALPRRPHRGLPNVEVLTQTSVTGLEGRDGMLEAIRWRQRGSGERCAPDRHLFLFIGAEPNTDWLSGSGVALDAKGFVLTGAAGERSPAAGDEPARGLRDRRRPLRLDQARRRGGRRGRAGGGDAACLPGRAERAAACSVRA